MGSANVVSSGEARDFEEGGFCKGRGSTGTLGLGDGIPLSRNFFLLFDLKMEHFGDVFKLDLTEETRTQLQQEEATATSCLLTMPMLRY